MVLMRADSCIRISKHLTCILMPSGQYWLQGLESITRTSPSKFAAVGLLF